MFDMSEDATNDTHRAPMTITHVQYSRGGGNTMPARPMFLCLHGWGSNETDITNIMQYIAPYNDYASLRAPIVLQPAHDDRTSGAYSWFPEPSPTGDDLDRAALAAATAIDQWVDEQVSIERDVVPIGFSQGGLLAVHLLRIHPERYRAAISLSGFLAPGTAAADDRLPAFDTPVFFAYGKNDEVIPKYELFAAAAWLEEHTWLTTHSYHGLGHEVSLDEFADLRQWLLLNDIAPGIL